MLNEKSEQLEVNKILEGFSKLTVKEIAHIVTKDLGQMMHKEAWDYAYLIDPTPALLDIVITYLKVSWNLGRYSPYGEGVE